MQDSTLALLLPSATWALSSVTGVVVGIEDVDLFGPSSQQHEGYDPIASCRRNRCAGPRGRLKPGDRVPELTRSADIKLNEQA